MPIPVDEFIRRREKTPYDLRRTQERSHRETLSEKKDAEYLRDLAEIQEALDTTECPDPLPTASTGHDQLSEDNDC